MCVQVQTRIFSATFSKEEEAGRGGGDRKEKDGMVDKLKGLKERTGRQKRGKYHNVSSFLTHWFEHKQS